MNRREALKLLLAGSTALVLPTVLMHMGRESLWFVDKFVAFGNASESVPSWAALRRKGSQGALLHFGLNAFGGALDWSAPPGGAFVVTSSHPVEVAAGPHVTARAMLWDGYQDYRLIGSADALACAGARGDTPRQCRFSIRPSTTR